jgi:hypothetical protein
MGVLVNLSRGSHTPSITVASIIIDIPAFEVLKVWSSEVVGMANAAAAGESHGLYLATALGTVGTPTALTFKPENDTQTVPSGWEARYGFSVEPTLEAVPRLALPFQPAGGVGQWPVVAGSPLIFHNKSAAAIRCALRSILGTSPIALNLRLELGV